GRRAAGPARGAGPAIGGTSMTRMLVASMALVATLLSTGSLAGAGEPGSPFDLSLRWGPDRVTLDGRVDGPLGPASGSLRGRVGRDGITIDGWVDERGRTWTFELDANL